MADPDDERLIADSPWFDAAWYKSRYPETAAFRSAAAHFLDWGAALGHDPGPAFEGLAYAEMQAGERAPGEAALLHHERARAAEPGPADYAVLVHAYHPHTFAELRRALYAFPPSVDVYVSHPPERAADVAAAFPGATLVPVANQGQDLGAFLATLDALPRRYGFYCKLHSKSGDKWPDIWRAALLAGTVGSAGRVAAFARLFRDRPDVQIGGPRGLYVHGGAHMQDNAAHLDTAMRRAGLKPSSMPADWGFFAGSMFWIRDGAAALLRASVDLGAMDGGAVARDGQLAHALERLAGLIPAMTGGAVALTAVDDVEAAPEVVTGLPADIARHHRLMAEILPPLQAGMIADRTRRIASGLLPGLGFTRAAVAARRADRPEGDYAILTPTGDRPAAFYRCLQMVAAQTVRPRQWVVVDDGQVPLTDQMPLPDWVSYVRRAPVKGDPPHTLSVNVLAGLDHIRPDTVLIFEDDDWYAPTYAEFMLSQMGEDLLIGLQPIRYFHLGLSGWIHGEPPQHTAFAQSAFRRGHAWDHLAAVCRTNFQAIRETGVLDRHWWQTVEGRHRIIREAPCLHVGFKGGFGRPGRAEGHRAGDLGYAPDPAAAYLDGTIGPDRVIYDRWRAGWRKPFALYTVVDGTRPLSPPPAAWGLFDCYALSPRPVSAPGWTVLPIDAAPTGAHAAADLPRMLPGVLFPDYDWSVFVTDPEAAADPAALIEAAIARQAAYGLCRAKNAMAVRSHRHPVAFAQVAQSWEQVIKGDSGTSVSGEGSAVQVLAIADTASE